MSRRAAVAWVELAAAPAVQPAAAAAAALVAGAAVALSNSNTSVLPGCAFHFVTGLDCPLCGATRGLRQLLRGHPLAALDYNLLLIVIVPAALLSYLTWAGARLGLWQPTWAVGRGLSRVVTVTLVLFAIVRNLPIPTLHWLRSTS